MAQPDADKKARALLNALLEMSRDCPTHHLCHECMMQGVDHGCGCQQLRNAIGSVRFMRDE
jgi:hypothetical protein